MFLAFVVGLSLVNKARSVVTLLSFEVLNEPAPGEWLKIRHKYIKHRPAPQIGSGQWIQDEGGDDKSGYLFSPESGHSGRGGWSRASDEVQTVTLSYLVDERAMPGRAKIWFQMVYDVGWIISQSQVVDSPKIEFRIADPEEQTDGD